MKRLAFLFVLLFVGVLSLLVLNVSEVVVSGVEPGQAAQGEVENLGG